MCEQHLAFSAIGGGKQQSRLVLAKHLERVIEVAIDRTLGQALIQHPARGLFGQQQLLVTMQRIECALNELSGLPGQLRQFGATRAATRRFDRGIQGQHLGLHREHPGHVGRVRLIVEFGQHGAGHPSGINGLPWDIGHRAADFSPFEGPLRYWFVMSRRLLRPPVSTTRRFTSTTMSELAVEAIISWRRWVLVPPDGSVP